MQCVKPIGAEIEVANFTIKGIRLRIPDEQLSPPLIKALESGHYEWNEFAAIEKHLVQGDRVLDIGAGAGFISTRSAHIVGAENVVCVEASPEMVPVIQRNLNLNAASEVTLLHGAVVPDNFEGKNVEFKVAKAFWASRINTANSKAENVVSVPALHFTQLLEKYKPSVVIMDIEGGEVDICQQIWPPCVRLLIMEIHTKLYSPAIVKAMFDGLSRSGFTYMPWGTRGEVVVQQRVPD